MRIFTFQLTAHIGLLKEGGNKKKLSWADLKCSEGENYYRSFYLNLFEIGTKQELRSQKPEFRIENYRIYYILFSVFCFPYPVLVEDKKCFGVWPRHSESLL